MNLLEQLGLVNKHLKLIPPPVLPAPACIGCQAAKNAITRHGQLMASCQLCGKHYGKRS